MRRPVKHSLDISRARWPPGIAPLGEMKGGCPLDRCIACEPTAHPAVATTNVRYGVYPLCREHALSLAAGADLEFVSEALRLAMGGAGA